MYQLKVNDQDKLKVSIEPDNVSVNNKMIDWDLEKLPNGSYSIIADGKSYQAMVLEIDKSQKNISLLVNGHPYQINIQEPIDFILEKMGLNMTTKKKTESIKAPMPGLILKILVEEKQELKKGDPILILEAMKMENVFKAPADSTVKSIRIKEGQSVEKGEILIELA